MFRRSFACLAVAALAVAALVVVVDPASAQLLRRGRLFSGNSGNSGYYAPEYSGYTGDYYSSWGAPSYYGDNVQGGFYSPFVGVNVGTGIGTYGSSSFGPYGTTYGTTYGAFSPAGIDNHVLINVRVPPNAEVFFDDQRTSQIGVVRSFISPPLSSDRNFVYHIRARWIEDGRQVEKTRNIEVHPGDRLFVNFISPTRGFIGMPESERSFERTDNN